MAWNARAWVAEVLGCDVDELSVLTQEPGQVRYQDRTGEEVAWLVVAGPVKILEGPSDGRQEIMLRLPNGTFHRPDDVVPEAADIEF